MFSFGAWFYVPLTLQISFLALLTIGCLMGAALKENSDSEKFLLPGCGVGTDMTSEYNLQGAYQNKRLVLSKELNFL